MNLERLVAEYVGFNWPSNDSKVIGGIFLCPSSNMTTYMQGTDLRYKHGSSTNARELNSYTGGKMYFTGTLAEIQGPLKTFYYKNPASFPVHYCSRGRSQCQDDFISPADFAAGEIRDWSPASSWHGALGPRPTVFLDGHALVLMKEKYRQHLVEGFDIAPATTGGFWTGFTNYGCKPYETSIDEY